MTMNKCANHLTESILYCGPDLFPRPGVLLSIIAADWGLSLLIPGHRKVNDTTTLSTSIYMGNNTSTAC